MAFFVLFLQIRQKASECLKTNYNYSAATQINTEQYRVCTFYTRLYGNHTAVSFMLYIIITALAHSETN